MTLSKLMVMVVMVGTSSSSSSSVGTGSIGRLSLASLLHNKSPDGCQLSTVLEQLVLERAHIPNRLLSYYYCHLLNMFYKQLISRVLGTGQP